MTVGFVDEVQIHVTGGRGGDGCIAFRREKGVPRGGPSGGDGGDGGPVLLRATRRLNTLSGLRHRGHYRGEDGRPGEGSHRHGRRGGGEVVAIPLGTLVADAGSGALLADLREDGDEIVAAAGGRGGRGNARFATATRRAPRHRELGRPGDDRWLRLELRLLADVGLVGLPNAGKSTLISRISAARPRIAPFPFTTLVPNLGVVDWGEHRSFVVADLPGLIEGSHLGEGLGDQFLRHVQRTSVLLHLVDVSDLADLGAERAIDVIEEELGAFDPTLLERPRLLVATKMDASTSAEALDAVKAAGRRRGVDVLPVSAVAGAGLDELVRRTGELVEAHRGRWEAQRVADPAPSEEEEE